MEKSADAYRTISEVAEELKLPQHVLRFWETRFPQVKPMKRGGNRRFYRPGDVELLRAIKTLLYGDGFTIKGVQRILKEQGPRAVANLAQSGQLRSSNKRQGLPEEPAEAPVDPHRNGSGVDVMRAHSGPDGMRGQAEDEPKPRADSAAAGEEPRRMDLAPVDLVEGLQAVLFELSECERILAAARG